MVYRKKFPSDLHFTSFRWMYRLRGSLSFRELLKVVGNHFFFRKRVVHRTPLRTERPRSVDIWTESNSEEIELRKREKESSGKWSVIIMICIQLSILRSKNTPQLNDMRRLVALQIKNLRSRESFSDTKKRLKRREDRPSSGVIFPCQNIRNEGIDGSITRRFIEWGGRRLTD
jgi:hypothetical protein